MERKRFSSEVQNGLWKGLRVLSAFVWGLRDLLRIMEKGKEKIMEKDADPRSTPFTGSATKE